jgi:hypothetical protein
MMFPGKQGPRDPDGYGQTDGSSALHEWLRSPPEPGDAFVDTGLASAADCQKLRWSPDNKQRNLLSELMAKAVERDRKLFKSGNLEAEARRVNDLAAGGLQRAGLEPERFGVSTPEAMTEPSDGHK